MHLDSPEAWRVIWLVAAVAFAVAEMATPVAFFFLPFAVGAGSAALAAFAGVSVPLEWAVFVAVSASSFGALWPLGRRLERRTSSHPVGSRRWVGQEAYVLDAVVHAAPVAGDVVGNREVLTREEAVNAALLGVSYSGEVPVNGYGAYRGTTPPWATGTVIGTFVSSHRVGDVLLTAAPGEAYPDIRFALQRSVAGYSRLFTFGLANDQLGYLIAPSSEYPWIASSQPGNDNAFFNVSPTYGDHVLCAQTSAAVALGFAASGEPTPYGSDANAPACGAYAAGDTAPPGEVTQQPWPWGDGL